MPGKKGKVFPTSLEQLLKVTDPSTHKELRKRAENPISTLAENLKKMREEKGFSQRQVAEMSDLGVMTYKMLEWGLKDNNPRLRTLQSIAKVFGVHVFELFL